MNCDRQHPDPHVGAVPAMLVDRQRVVHSAAFRRLQYKTQVFVALEGDHFRTRLTHTLEVAHTARLLATMLGLNADWAEVVGLAHDLGHAPFGHAGERALDECLGDIGGFEHNRQSLRVVEYLEHPYPEFRGLNLTQATRACLASHETRYDRPDGADVAARAAAPLEGRVAAWGDQIAYSLHDLQDGLLAGVFSPVDLRGVDLWQRSDQTGDDAVDSWRGRVRPTLDRIQAELLAGLKAEYQRDSSRLSLSTGLQREFDRLADFLRERLYQNHRLVRSDSKARRIIHAVFDAYVREPHLLPPRYFRRIDEQGVARVAADYIAGMTDRYCAEEHARLFDSRAEF